MSTEQDLVKDKHNPLSLVNKTNTGISVRIAAIPLEILEMKEADLEHHADVHDVERKLRAAFQMEYERAVRTGLTMDSTNIYKGICSSPYWHKYVVGNSYKLAYVIKPYPDYEAQLEDMLQLGLDEMRKILKQPLKDKEGKFDHKLAALKANITEKLQDRRRGAVAQKMLIDQKSMNVNITKDVTQAPANIQDIDRRLAELEGKDVPAITYKDVTSEQEEV